MYHYITLWWMTLNMTGLWVILFLCVFIFLVYRESRWRWLHFQSFLRYLPTFILITYLSGSYFYYLFDQFIIIPLSIDQLLLYVTPYQYNFSVIGIIIGMIFWAWKFLAQKEKKDARVSAWLYWTVWWLIPLWVFLLLWDAFIGVSTNSWLYVSAIRSDSTVAIYDKVVPLGLYLSFIGLVWGSVLYLIHKKLSQYHWYLWFSLLALSLGILFIFQQYPRRLVFDLWAFTIDSKQIFLFILSIIFLLFWVKAYYTSKSISK